MAWLGNMLVGLALTIGLGIPDTITYVAPPPLTIEEKILAELPPVFIEIAKAESQMNPNAYNNEWHYDTKGNKLCQGSFSILQVACFWYEEAGIPEEMYYNVDINIQLAKAIYEDGGTKPWGVCRTGKVKCN